MRFLAYHDGLENDKKISVDGFVPNALCLTHWPGNRTPHEFKGDTTTEIVIRLLESGRYGEVTKGYEIITNNHFDTDGLIPSWLLLNPTASPDLFPKLDWPRIPNPDCAFPLEGDNLAATEAREKESLAAMGSVLENRGESIAAILLEPIQCEGGDHHMRGEYFQAVQKL